MPTQLILSRDLLERVIMHCKSVYPHEACGLLAGQNQRVEKIYEMMNIEHSSVSYMVDPAEQFRAVKDMRKIGDKMLAIFHSHPHSPAYPSPKDVSLAFYPDSVYLIVGLTDVNHPEVKAYEIIEGEVREVRIECAIDAPVENGLNLYKERNS